MSSEDSLHSLSPIDLSFTTGLLIQRRGGPIEEHIRCSAIDICKRHRKTLILYCCIYSELYSNRSYPIVGCIFVVAGMCLPSRFPTMGHNVTILSIMIYTTVCNTTLEIPAITVQTVPIIILVPCINLPPLKCFNCVYRLEFLC